MKSFDPRAQSHTSSARHVLISAEPARGETVAGSYWTYSHNDLYDKATATRDAFDLIAHFCLVNGIAVPAFTLNRSMMEYGRCSRWSGGSYLIELHDRKCKLPQAAGRSWSWPGYKADVTVLGVVAHECGHHAHWNTGTSTSRFFREYALYIEGEERVSSYEPNIGESIAEAMKVFITNPTLLKLAWPRRYSYLRRHFEPVVSADWTEILADSPRHLNAVANRIFKYELETE